MSPDPADPEVPASEAGPGAEPASVTVPGVEPARGEGDTAGGVEAAGEVMAQPTAPGAARARSGRRTGVAIVAISLIAVLAGGTLFLSGWTLGRQTALTPGTPADET